MAPRRKAPQAARREPPASRSKRTRNDDDDDDDADAEQPKTPSKRRRGVASPEPVSGGEEGRQTAESDSGEPPATARRARRPGRPSTRAAAAAAPPSPPKQPATPRRAVAATTPSSRRQAADRSARRKSARALMDSIARDEADDGFNDDGCDDGHRRLARDIYQEGDADEDGSGSGSGSGSDSDSAAAAAAATATAKATATPTKRPRRAARAGGKAPSRSPTPPADLPPHELYFAHNKPGRPRTSDRTLAAAALLTHDAYFGGLRRLERRHGADVRALEALHAESFPQWAFELRQGFSLCLYGVGSKRGLLRAFARFLHARGGGETIVVVNGYVPGAGAREILGCVASAAAAAAAAAASASEKQQQQQQQQQQQPPPLPASSTPAAMAHGLAAQLTSLGARLVVVVNSIDAAPLRRAATQAALARLAAHPLVGLVCSADTPDFGLLWDVGLRSAFNFAFHDGTTYAPLAAELDAVDDVHDLLGRPARRAAGRDGVAFVLRSLPDNARNLFCLLVGEVLVAMDDDDGGDDSAAAGGEPAAVEYRMVYNKAVEEFICTSEMAFRTLLKEFHDHQIITSRKDAVGTELLSVPFPREELEAILEHMME